MPDLVRPTQPPPPPGQQQPQIGLAERYRQIRKGAGIEAAREFGIQQLHELLMADWPMDVIADRFGVDLATVYRWRKLLYERLSEEALTVDPHRLLGSTMAYYDTLAAKALRIYDMSGVKPGDRLRAIEVAGAQKEKMVKLLQAAGFFEHAKLTPKTEDDKDGRSDAVALVDMLKKVLTGARDDSFGDDYGTEDGDDGAGDGDDA